MPVDDPRPHLAEAQAELLRALAGRTSPPAGFDTARVRATSRALVSKRSRAAARTWPGLAVALGSGWSERFAAFAQTHTLPRDGGPLADGYAFAGFLRRAGELPDEGRLEVLAVTLRYRACASGLLPRRGVRICACFLARPRRWVLAVRLPVLGERWFRFP